jgi:hypothetical protein
VQLVTTATGLGRYWTLSITDVNPITANADQADWDFEGDSVAVTLRVEWAADVGNAIGAPDTINVRVKHPNGGADVGSLWTFTPAGDSGSATRTLHFDTDPLDQSLAAAANRRFGMLELYLQVIDDPGGGTNDYTLDSRGTASVGPPALTTYSWARGLIRQKATVSSLSVSDASLGGAEPVAWFYNYAVYTRAILATGPYESAGTISALIRRPQAQGGAQERLDTLSSLGAGAVTMDFAFDDTTTSTSGDGRVGGGMFVGNESKDIDVSFPSAQIDGIERYAWATSQPAGFTVVDEHTIRYVGRLVDVDPRINFGGNHLFQIDDSVFGTPPMSKNVTPAQRLGSQFGFLASRATRSDGISGLNGITWSTKLWDDSGIYSEANPAVNQSNTSATQGGESGWDGSLVTWEDDKPGGTWSKKVVITAPSLAVGLELDNTATLTLIATDPRIVLNLAAGDPTTPGTHWRPGSQLTIGLRLFNEFTPVTSDAGTGLVGILRFNAATGRLQHLASVSPSVWTDIANGTPITTYAMTPSPGDSHIQIKTFTGAETADFATNDVFIIGQLKHDGAPYQGFGITEVVSTFFRHDIAAAAASIAESSILFDGTNGHDHTGGTTGKAIGDRS